jgi:hypothetical protein
MVDLDPVLVLILPFAFCLNVVPKYHLYHVYIHNFKHLFLSLNMNFLYQINTSLRSICCLLRAKYFYFTALFFNPFKTNFEDSTLQFKKITGKRSSEAKTTFYVVINFRKFYLPRKAMFQNVHKMKNKPDPTVQNFISIQ